ncbi:MAG: hypothetical protein ACRDRX_23575 [Pseudonocardiaceae bacterium]
MTTRDNHAATVEPLTPRPDTDPEQQLADHIRHIVDTAPRPNPDQLARLAGLLRPTTTNHKPDPATPAEHDHTNPKKVPSSKVS